MDLVAKCSNCNVELDVDDQGYIYCPKCGVKSEKPLTQKPKKGAAGNTEKSTNTKPKNSSSKNAKTAKNNNKTGSKTNKSQETDGVGVNQKFKPSGDKKLDNKLSIAYKNFEEGNYFGAEGICSSILAEYKKNIYATSIMAQLKRSKIEKEINEGRIPSDRDFEHVEKLYQDIIDSQDADENLVEAAKKDKDTFIEKRAKFYFKYKAYKVDQLDATIYNKKAQNVYIDNPIYYSKSIIRYKNPLPDGTTEQHMVTMTSNNAIMDDTLTGMKRVERKKEAPTHVNKSELFGDTNPITFPAKSSSKFVKISFWVLSFFVVIYALALYSIFFNPSFAGADAWAKTTTAELVMIVGSGLFVIAGWLFWIIYFFVRLLKKEDLTQPAVIPKIRLAAVATLIISLIYTVWKFGSLAIATAMPDQLPDFDIHATTTQIIISAVLLAVSIIMLIVLGVIDRTRLKMHMRTKPTVNARVVVLAVLHTLESLALIVVVVSGLIMLVNALKPDLLSLVFGVNASMAATVAKPALIVSSSVFAASCIADILLTNSHVFKKHEKLPLCEETNKTTQITEEISGETEQYYNVILHPEEQSLVNREKALFVLGEIKESDAKLFSDFSKGKITSLEKFYEDNNNLCISDIPEQLYKMLIKEAGVKKEELK